MPAHIAAQELVGLRVRGPEDLGPRLAAVLGTGRQLVWFDLGRDQRLKRIGGIGSPPCTPALLSHLSVVSQVQTDIAGILVAHSHTDGSTAPSEHDLQWTQALICPGRRLRPPILDHFISSGTSWRSLRESTKLWSHHRSQVTDAETAGCCCGAGPVPPPGGGVADSSMVGEAGAGRVWPALAPHQPDLP